MLPLIFSLILPTFVYADLASKCSSLAESSISSVESCFVNHQPHSYNDSFCNLLPNGRLLVTEDNFAEIANNLHTEQKIETVTTAAFGTNFQTGSTLRIVLKTMPVLTNGWMHINLYHGPSGPGLHVSYWFGVYGQWKIQLHPIDNNKNILETNIVILNQFIGANKAYILEFKNTDHGYELLAGGNRYHTWAYGSAGPPGADGYAFIISGEAIDDIFSITLGSRYFGPMERCYRIGLDTFLTQKWKWITNDKLSWFARGESLSWSSPNNNCVCYHVNEKLFKTVPCYAQIPYICEYTKCIFSTANYVPIPNRKPSDAEEHIEIINKNSFWNRRRLNCAIICNKIPDCKSFCHKRDDLCMLYYNVSSQMVIEQNDGYILYDKVL